MPDPQLAMARERLGHVLKDRWVLEDVLGVGGMAAVYAARHRNGAKAAIKVLHGPLSEDHVVRERFLREAYLANSLEHIGTVHVLDDDADPRLGPFLVMELLDGGSILELLDKGVAFDVPVALDIADQTLDVLAAAHDRGIVHRDLKPANLFLCRNGQVKVLDFGIARVLDANQARLTRTGVPIGTPAYMAPEQARGQGRDADGRADLYALGATLFRMLAGRHVHVGRGAEQIAKVATSRAPKLATVAKLPPALCAVVDRSLEFEQERRYANAREMQEDVRALVRGAAPPIASRPLPDPGPVPALPALKPKKRKEGHGGDAPDDQVTELAESLRQRAHEAARRPDAFTVMPGGPADEDDDDENMPTVVGGPRDMVLGSKPTALADLRRPPPPRRAAQAMSGRSNRTAAQVFARIPNVPVPILPEGHARSRTPPLPRGPIVDDEAPTIARGDIPLALRADVAMKPARGRPPREPTFASAQMESPVTITGPLVTPPPPAAYLPPVSAGAERQELAAARGRKLVYRIAIGIVLAVLAALALVMLLRR